jgi:hypothetical protein
MIPDKFINKKLRSLDDISFYQSKLSELFDEVFLGLPFKYHENISKNIELLNYKLDEKMEIIRTKSSKHPIKLSLMNYKL